MRTTIDLDASLVAQAKDLTGITDTSVLIHEALKALIECESAHRLARLGGSQPDIKLIPRRRPKRH